MFANYDEAINWIHSRLKFGVKPGLKRMEWFLEKYNHPEENLQIIHVAGTNGKGSTISYMRHMLMEAGYKVGTFTSPYIELFNERISVNGQPISDEAMLSLVNEIKPYVEQIEQTELGSPTEFEVITMMMYLYFGKYNQPDFLLLETGLGGRLDSTNVINHPLLSIITNVGYDHMNILGNTIEEIAAEKAGIIKSGVPVFTAIENENGIQVVKDVAKRKNAPLFIYGTDFNIVKHQLHRNGELFSLETSSYVYDDVLITMKGEHQTKNAALAISAIDYLKRKNIVNINEMQLKTALEKTNWIGRFEKVYDNPEVIIDGAHNIEGIESLVSTLKRHYGNRNIHFLVSILNDKNYEEMIHLLTRIATSMHFTSFDFPRAAKASELYSVCELGNKSYSDDWVEKIQNLLKIYENRGDDLIVVVGSLYFISHIRNYFYEKNNWSNIPL
ncbi:bifunctional folylpolyglutamate synthase/dihydrofolate synthase [Bacillus sp. 7586-K]|nr:bifunctional folylpolyglutamate synthase/dihydrofolate synthase [Bacillus sp. 7586-K]